MTNPDEFEVAPGFAHEHLQGRIWELASPDDLRAGLEQGFDYRGKTLADSFVRLFPAGGKEKVAISYADIAGLTFSGRDTAAGKSWAAWVKRYLEKKTAGEKIDLQPEKLE
jgi:hypothetical protein